jgi:hypothetical protein
MPSNNGSADINGDTKNYGRKFRSQASDFWTDAAIVVRAVRVQKKSEERRSTRAKG